MKYTRLLCAMLFILLGFSSQAWPVEKIHYDFETDREGWDIPNWAFEQTDHVGRITEISSDEASTGKGSLKVMCNFPGNVWRAVVVENEKDRDLTDYNTISFDVFLPKAAGGDLYQARIMLTVGDWYFIESRKVVSLKHGEWTRVTANLRGGYDRATGDWKCKDDEKSLGRNIDKVKKVGIRIEYNANPWQGGPPYEGPVYIDNVVIE